MIDTVAPNGIGMLSQDSGEWEILTVRLRVMFRKVGGEAWKDGGEIVYEERKPRTRRRSRRVKFPTRGHTGARAADKRHRHQRHRHRVNRSMVGGDQLFPRRSGASE